MKIAVRYYTKTGNTKKLANAIANAVGVESLDDEYRHGDIFKSLM